jgi:hypothetical protein
MHLENKHPVYKRLLLLRLMCVCLLVFGSSTITGKVFSAKCIQDCDPDLAGCQDACASACATADAACNSCLASCQTSYNQCLGYAVWCSGGGYSYTPHCQVYYGDHCEPGSYPGAPPDCSAQGLHSGYYQVCDHGAGGQMCVACPLGERCLGSNGTPPCP